MNNVQIVCRLLVVSKSYLEIISPCIILRGTCIISDQSALQKRQCELLHLISHSFVYYISQNLYLAEQLLDPLIYRYSY